MSGKWNLAQLKSMLLESLFIALPESVLIDHEWQQANGDSLRERPREMQTFSGLAALVQ